VTVNSRAYFYAKAVRNTFRKLFSSCSRYETEKRARPEYGPDFRERVRGKKRVSGCPVSADRKPSVFYTTSDLLVAEHYFSSNVYVARSLTATVIPDFVHGVTDKTTRRSRDLCVLSSDDRPNSGHETGPTVVTFLSPLFAVEP